jgi:hypothetical protein
MRGRERGRRKQVQTTLVCRPHPHVALGHLHHYQVLFCTLVSEQLELYRSYLASKEVREGA